MPHPPNHRLRITDYGLFLLLLTLLPACTEDFAEINTNTNAPATVQPELLLRQVLYGYGDAMSYEGFVSGNLLSQHFAMTDFNLFDRHALSSPQEGGNPWPILYTHLRDTETLLQLSRGNPARAVYEGPALVIKAYLALTLTDLFGDVPYREAFRGRSAGVVKPAYDRQEDIYLAAGGILANLEEAVAVMDDYRGPQALAGDLLYGGNLDNWVRFANSLRLRALLRISARHAPGTAIQELYDDGRLLLTNEQNATFDFTAGLPNSFAFATARQGIFDVFLMSRTAEGILTPLNDARTSVFFRRSRAGGTFRGAANGVASPDEVDGARFSPPGTVWRENTGDLDFNYLTAWETSFLLAEAALRGYLDADPRTLYERGVTQAHAYWLAPLPAGYLTIGPAAYDPDRALEQVITQKWIASIGNGYEAWTEWRRTGFPALLPVAASLNDGLYPVRFPYPADEQALNFDNYQKAAAATEGNSINVPVWWDE